jgi:hypothetical protein
MAAATVRNEANSQAIQIKNNSLCLPGRPAEFASGVWLVDLLHYPLFSTWRNFQSYPIKIKTLKCLDLIGEISLGLAHKKNYAIRNVAEENTRTWRLRKTNQQLSRKPGNWNSISESWEKLWASLFNPMHQ